MMTGWRGRYGPFVGTKRHCDVTSATKDLIWWLQTVANRSRLCADDPRPSIPCCLKGGSVGMSMPPSASDTDRDNLRINGFH